MLTPEMRALDLQVAYQISEEVTDRPTQDLFWAVDRFYYDRAETPDGKAQRFEATQRIARELDARNVPVRDPNGPKAYPRRP